MNFLTLSLMVMIPLRLLPMSLPKRNRKLNRNSQRNKNSNWRYGSPVRLRSTAAKLSVTCRLLTRKRCPGLPTNLLATRKFLLQQNASVNMPCRRPPHNKIAGAAELPPPERRRHGLDTHARHPSAHRCAIATTRKEQL